MKRKRPKSVLIATVVACFISILSVVFVWHLLTGDAEVQKLYLNGLKDPFFIGRIVLSWICFPALLFKTRAKGTYYLTSTLLGFIVISTVLSAAEPRNVPPFGNTISTQIFGWVLVFLAGFLFYRFTFGKPSRGFFELGLE